MRRMPVRRATAWMLCWPLSSCVGWNFMFVGGTTPLAQSYRRRSAATLAAGRQT